MRGQLEARHLSVQMNDEQLKVPKAEILLLSHYFEPELGAPQRRWSAFASALTERGFVVNVIAPLPHHPAGRMPQSYRSMFDLRHAQKGKHGALVHRVRYLAHDGTVIRRTMDHLFVGAATLLRVRKLVRTGEIAPAVVIATAPALPTALVGRAASWLIRVPFVLEMRDAWPDLLSNTPGLRRSLGLKGQLKRSLARLLTRIQASADYVVVTTESFAAALRSRGVPRVRVIRNGTDPQRYRTVTSGSSSDRQSVGELRALYMGTIGRSQGLEVIVRAAAQLRAEGQSVHVRIVGYGADFAGLTVLNARLGGPVELQPSVGPSEVLEHYRWADTCITSLRGWQPFNMTIPSKLYELMATGKHVTAILDGEGANIVRATGSGDVVRPGDVNSLVELWRSLSGDPARLQIGSRGQMWVEENANDHSLGNLYANLIDEIVASPR